MQDGENPGQRPEVAFVGAESLDRLGDSHSVEIGKRETTTIDGLMQRADQAAAILVATDVGQPLLAWLANFFLVNSAQS